MAQASWEVKGGMAGNHFNIMDLGWDGELASVPRPSPLPYRKSDFTHATMELSWRANDSYPLSVPVPRACPANPVVSGIFSYRDKSRFGRE